MTSRTLHAVIAGVSILAAASSLWAKPKGPAYPDPQHTDADFVFQGEYAGQAGHGQDAGQVGVQVIALGNGKFQAVVYFGGLPGDGWNGEEPVRADGQLKEGRVQFACDQGSGVLQDGAIVVRDAEGKDQGTLKKVHRQSPTLGNRAPAGAVVLFDGTQASLENWKGGRITDDGLLMQGTTSKHAFGDQTVHFEFRLAYQPLDRGQGRSNSGIYLQGRYEVQILDSFGLEGKQNECGGLYSVKDPDVNMCFPPLSWQTFDIDYTAAKYGADGKLVANPRITVRHNGVVVHDDVELPGNRSTTAAPVKPGPDPGPLYLQNHGCPVRYRNIWVVPK